MKKKIVKIICFICLLALLLGGINAVFKFKYSDGIRQMTQFYEEEEDTIDVLFFGSSHAYRSFYPEIFWRDYGYSSFTLAAAVQPMWSTYHYMVEALKTQTPEVIVLEGYRLLETADYKGRGNTIKSLYGLKWSENKLDAIEASVYKKGALEPEKEAALFTPAQIAEIEQIPNEFANYHSRYSQLSEADFLPDYGDPAYAYHKGGIVATDVYTDYKRPDVESFEEEPLPLTEKTEEYYRKILELGKEHGIPVVTVIAPFYIRQHEYGVFLTAEKIAEEYGQEFINYNEMYDEIGFDFKTDILDEFAHINLSGVEKFNTHLGQYLKENYDLPDHRGDEAYQSWENGAKRYERVYGTKNGLTELADGGDYAARLLDEREYSFAVVLNGTEAEEGYSEEAESQIRSVFDTLGLECGDITDGVWFFENGELQWTNTEREGFQKALRFDRYNDVRFEYGVTDEKDETLGFFIRKDDGTLISCEDLLTIYVYDNYSCAHVDTYRCDTDGDRVAT